MVNILFDEAHDGKEIVDDTYDPYWGQGPDGNGKN